MSCQAFGKQCYDPSVQSGPSNVIFCNFETYESLELIYSFLSVSLVKCVCLTTYHKRWCMLSSACIFYLGVLQKLSL